MNKFILYFPVSCNWPTAPHKSVKVSTYCTMQVVNNNIVCKNKEYNNCREIWSSKRQVDIGYALTVRISNDSFYNIMNIFYEKIQIIHYMQLNQYFNNFPGKATRELSNIMLKPNSEVLCMVLLMTLICNTCVFTLWRVLNYHRKKIQFNIQ